MLAYDDSIVEPPPSSDDWLEWVKFEEHYMDLLKEYKEKDEIISASELILEAKACGNVPFFSEAELALVHDMLQKNPNVDAEGALEILRQQVYSTFGNQMPLPKLINLGIDHVSEAVEPQLVDVKNAITNLITGDELLENAQNESFREHNSSLLGRFLESNSHPELDGDSFSSLPPLRASNHLESFLPSSNDTSTPVNYAKKHLLNRIGLAEDTPGASPAFYTPRTYFSPDVNGANVETKSPTLYQQQHAPSESFLSAASPDITSTSSQSGALSLSALQEDPEGINEDSFFTTPTKSLNHAPPNWSLSSIERENATAEEILTRSSRMKKQINKLRSDLRAAEERLADLEEQNKELSTESSSQMRRISEYQAEQRQLLHRIEELETKLMANSEQLGDSVSQTLYFKNIAAAHQDTIVELKRELELKDNQVQIANECIDQCQDEFHKTQSQKHDLEESLLHLQSLIESVSQQNANLRADNDDLHSTVAELSHTVSELSSFKSDQILENLDKEMNQNNVQTQTYIIEGALCSSSAQTDPTFDPEEEQQALKLLVPKINSLVEDISFVEKENATLKDEISSLQQQIMKSRHALSLRKHYDTEVNRWIASLRDDISKTEESSKTTKEELVNEIFKTQEMAKSFVEIRKKAGNAHPMMTVSKIDTPVQTDDYLATYDELNVSLWEENERLKMTEATEPFPRTITSSSPNTLGFGTTLLVVLLIIMVWMWIRLGIAIQLSPYHQLPDLTIGPIATTSELFHELLLRMTSEERISPI